MGASSSNNVEQTLETKIQEVVAKQQEVLELWDSKKERRPAATTGYKMVTFPRAFATSEKKMDQLRTMNLSEAILSSNELVACLAQFTEFETRINNLFANSDD